MTNEFPKKMFWVFLEGRTFSRGEGCVTSCNIFLNVQVSEVEIDEMFEVADTDRDGIIGFEEFMVIRRVGRRSSGRHCVSYLIPHYFQIMLNPPKMAQNTSNENWVLETNLKRNPAKIKDLTNEEMKKLDTRVAIENEKETKLEIKDLSVVLVSNAV